MAKTPLPETRVDLVIKDHSQLRGLENDDHPQYLTLERALEKLASVRHGHLAEDIPDIIDAVYAVVVNRLIFKGDASAKEVDKNLVITIESDHSKQKNLDADDHRQYLLRTELIPQVVEEIKSRIKATNADVVVTEEGIEIQVNSFPADYVQSEVFFLELEKIEDRISGLKIPREVNMEEIREIVRNEVARAINEFDDHHALRHHSEQQEMLIRISNLREEFQNQIKHMMDLINGHVNLSTDVHGIHDTTQLQLKRPIFISPVEEEPVGEKSVPVLPTDDGDKVDQILGLTDKTETPEEVLNKAGFVIPVEGK